ncbi:MAG: hypothetical protein AAFU67_13950 [Bacteroidota bacterium]
MNNELDSQHLKELIAQNRTEQVFTALKASAFFAADSAFQNKVTLVEARWKKLKEDRIKGLLSTGEQTLATNRINNDLIDLLDGIGKPSATTTPTSTDAPATLPTEKPKKTSWTSFFAIFAATIAVLAGIAEISGYSIRDWWEAKTPTTETEVPEQPTTDTAATAEPAAQPTAPSTPPGQTPTIDKPKKEEELPPAKEKLQVQIKTQKGDQDVTFSASEEVRLFFKVNRPCVLRTIYRLADETLILLDNDRIVNAPETNKWVQLSDGFEVAPPFGREELYLFAQEKDFPALKTEQKDGYTIIKEGLPTALRKTRGLKKKQVFAEDQLNITTQNDY